MAETTLTTVPTFRFDQGDIWDQESVSERPIDVLYYNGIISLEQNGNEVLLLPENINALFRAIKKHLPEALKKLEK